LVFDAQKATPGGLMGCLPGIAKEHFRAVWKIRYFHS